MRSQEYEFLSVFSSCFFAQARLGLGIGLGFGFEFGFGLGLGFGLGFGFGLGRGFFRIGSVSRLLTQSKGKFNR